MSVTRAELRRLVKRRLTRWMLALVLALLATVVAVMFAEHQQPGPAAVAEAEARAEREIQEFERFIAQDIAQCERDQAAGGAAAQDWPGDCQELRGFGPTREDMIDAFMPPAFEFRTDFRPMITVFASLLALFGFIVGASFVGAEWRAGGMMNLLLWRPRRVPVLGAKLLALLAALLGLGVLLGALWTGAFWLVATFRGTTEAVTSGVWQSLGLDGVRGVTLVLVAGAVGFALASLGRHTAMAMGAAIAAFVVGVAGVGILGELLRVGFWQRWLWTTYIQAWMDRSVTVQDFNAPCEPGPFGECVVPELEITWQQSGIGIAVLLAVLLAAAMWHMRRRDVT